MWDLFFITGMAILSGYTWLFPAKAPEAKSESVDESHVIGSVALRESQNSLTLETGPSSDSSSRSFFHGSNSIQFGGSYGPFSLAVEEPLEVRGCTRDCNDTKNQNLFTSIAKRQFGVELFYHNNQGFEASGAVDDDNPVWEVGSGNSRHRNDLRIVSQGFNVFYVFFPEWYSPEAGMTFSERRTTWGWSPFVMVSHDSYSILADADLIPKGNQSQFGDGAAFSGGLFSTTSLAAGWGFIIPHRNYFASFNLLFGLGSELRCYSLDGQTVNEAGYSKKGYLNAALGYNGERAITGVSLLFDNKVSLVRNVDVLYQNNSAQLFYRRRF